MLHWSYFLQILLKQTNKKKSIFVASYSINTKNRHSRKKSNIFSPLKFQAIATIKIKKKKRTINNLFFISCTRSNRTVKKIKQTFSLKGIITLY